jgi:hypothetical protein
MQASKPKEGKKMIMIKTESEHYAEMLEGFMGYFKRIPTDAERQHLRNTYIQYLNIEGIDDETAEELNLFD